MQSISVYYIDWPTGRIPLEGPPVLHFRAFQAGALLQSPVLRMSVPSTRLRSLPLSLLPFGLAVGVAFVALLFSSDAASADHSKHVLINCFHQLLGLPPEQLEHVNWLMRKCAHMTEYGLLCFCVLRCHPFEARRRLSGWLQILVVVFVCACVDEYYQTFIPGRTGQFFDVLEDSIGGLCMLAAHAAAATHGRWFPSRPRCPQ